MKKIVLFGLVATVTVFQFCHSSKKVVVSNKVSYASQVQPLIQASCSPCHIPPQGRATALNTYEAAKTHIDSMITRVQMNPSDKGFMPMRHPKLSDTAIAVLVQWKQTGLSE